MLESCLDTDDGYIVHGRECAIFIGYAGKTPRVHDNGEASIAAGNQNLMSVNDLIEVAAADDPGPSIYLCRVNNSAGAAIVIAWPTQRGIRLPARANQILGISFVHEGIPYAFDTLAMERLPAPMPQITITPLRVPTRRRRRKSVRVKCLVPGEITEVQDNSDSSDAAQRGMVLNTVICDLSASGLRVCLPMEIPEGASLTVKLSLPDTRQPMKMPCGVVYSDTLRKTKGCTVRAWSSGR